MVTPAGGVQSQVPTVVNSQTLKVFPPSRTSCTSCGAHAVLASARWGRRVASTARVEASRASTMTACPARPIAPMRRVRLRWTLDCLVNVAPPDRDGRKDCHSDRKSTRELKGFHNARSETSHEVRSRGRRVLRARAAGHSTTWERPGRAMPSDGQAHDPSGRPGRDLSPRRGWCGPRPSRHRGAPRHRTATDRGHGRAAPASTPG